MIGMNECSQHRCIFKQERDGWNEQTEEVNTYARPIIEMKTPRKKCAALSDKVGDQQGFDLVARRSTDWHKLSLVTLCGFLGQLNQHFNRLLHTFDGNKLMNPVEVITAGKQVRTRQTHK